MSKKRIIIDVATIYPGIGGAGGGIWSYAKNLLLYLDKQEGKEHIEFICLVNKEFDLPLQTLKVKRLNLNFKNFIIRFLYTHILLPVYIVYKRALLHNLYFDSPVYIPSRLLVTIHDCMGDFYKKKKYANKGIMQRLKFWYFNFLNRRAIKQSRYICTPSHAIKNEIVKRYFTNPEKIFVTPLATNVYTKIQKKQKLGETLNLYCIAAFHRHKGHLRLIEIFESLIAQYEIDVNLYLRGHIHDIEYFTCITSKIDASKAKERIHIVKYEAQSSLEEIYSDADWIILLSEYEGFGLPVIEAQANGVPVICSDIPTFKEVAGEAAFYIQHSQSAGAAAEKLYNILTDEKSRQIIIQQGLINAGKYNWNAFAKQVFSVYKAVTA